MFTTASKKNTSREIAWIPAFAGMTNDYILTRLGIRHIIQTS